jgi:hypothetical protein
MIRGCKFFSKSSLFLSPRTWREISWKGALETEDLYGVVGPGSGWLRPPVERMTRPAHTFFMLDRGFITCVFTYIHGALLMLSEVT